MRNNKQVPFTKTITWVYSAVAAFTTISVVAPIIWDKLARKQDQRLNR